MKPSAWFVRALGILDPLLSVRRSVVTSHWVIERKAYIAPSEVATLRRRRDRIARWINFPNENQKEQLHKNRKAWQSLCDEVASAEQGKRVIVRPRALTQEVYDGLCRSDFRRYGGAARFCTQLEQEEERRDADYERMMSNKRTAMNAECYDIINFLERRKSDAMANRPETELDLRYLLHGKNSKTGDAPLIQLSEF